MVKGVILSDGRKPRVEGSMDFLTINISKFTCNSKYLFIIGFYA